MPIKLKSTMGNPRHFIFRDTIQKNHITLRAHLIWDTSDINWSSVILKLGNAEITLPNLVTVPLVDKYRIRSIMENTTLLPYIMVLTGDTWQAPQNPNALPNQDINHF